MHGIFQASILEGVAVSSSTGSSRPRDRTYISCSAGRFFSTVKPQMLQMGGPELDRWKRCPGVVHSYTADLRFFLFPRARDTDLPQSAEEMRVYSQNKYFGAES